MRYAWLMTAVALVGCNGGKDDTGDTTGGGGNTDACNVVVDETVPSDGATDAFYRSDVEFHLSEADASATLTLTDAAGTAVGGTQSANDDGTVVYFSADGGLAPSTTYTATLSVCDGEKNPAISFTTSSTGGDLTVDLTGRTYTVSLANARIVEPAGVGDLLTGSFDQDILVGVQGVSDTTLTMLGAMSGSEGGQDYCNPTIDFPDADFTESPYFIVGPQDTTIDAAGYTVPINQLMISGAFASDGSLFTGGVLAGELDARDLGPLVVDLIGTDDPDEICALLLGFGVSCETCSSDSETYCVSILADQITAPEDASTTLECVPTTDCNANCADSAANADCDTDNYPVCE